MAHVRMNPYEVAVKDYHYMGVPDDNCFTGLYGEAIVGVGGLHVKWDGVGLLWLMLPADFKKHGLSGVIALSAIKDKMNELLEINGIWHAQANIRTDFPEAIKMIEFFGFERKCKMEKFAPDKSDMYLYSKVL